MLIYFWIAHKFVESNPDVVAKEENYLNQSGNPVVTVALKEIAKSQLTFNTAKTTLKVMSNYFRDNNMIKNSRESYKTDGTLVFKNLEILLTESSGPFLNQLRSKYNFDLHKGIFGCLAMLKLIADKYEYASLNTSELLKVHLLHAKGK